MFKTFEYQSKVFFGFLSLTLLVQLVLLFFYLNKMNNILFMNIYLLIIMLYHLFLSSYILKFHKIISILLMSSILFLFYYKNVFTFNIYAFIICSLFVCITNSLIILKLVKQDDLLFSNPQFYISAGLLIFMFSISGPLLLMNFMVIHNFKILGKYYGIISSCITLIANIFYIKAFLCSKKQIS